MEECLPGMHNPLVGYAALFFKSPKEYILCYIPEALGFVVGFLKPWDSPFPAAITECHR